MSRTASSARRRPAVALEGMISFFDVESARRAGRGGVSSGGAHGQAWDGGRTLNLKDPGVTMIHTYHIVFTPPFLISKPSSARGTRRALCPSHAGRSRPGAECRCRTGKASGRRDRQARFHDERCGASTEAGKESSQTGSSKRRLARRRRCSRAGIWYVPRLAVLSHVPSHCAFADRLQAHFAMKPVTPVKGVRATRKRQRRRRRRRCRRWQRRRSSPWLFRILPSVVAKGRAHRELQMPSSRMSRVSQRSIRLVILALDVDRVLMQC